MIRINLSLNKRSNMDKGIKLTGTKLRNFAKFGVIEVEYPEGVSYLCGANGAGKSSLTMVGLQACLKGIYENNLGNNIIGSRFSFIGPNGRSADLGYTFLDQRDNRKFTITNHITSTSNNIKVEAEDGENVPKEWMEDFLSISLMSESHFCSLTGKEQAIALGVNTDKFDEILKELKNELTILNRELKSLGPIEPIEECTPVDIDALKKKKNEIANQLNQWYLENISYNKKLRDQYDSERALYEQTARDMQVINLSRENKIDRCKDALTILFTHGYKGNEVAEFIGSLPLPETIPVFESPEPKYIDELPPDDSIRAVEVEIENAYADLAKVERYKEYRKKLSMKETTEREIETNQTKQEQVKLDRIAYINSFNFSFSGLSTNEKGELELNGRPIKKPYFSTGERIKIVAKLMASRHPLFKTVFLDSACELDPDNLEAITTFFEDEGFKVIVSIPNEQRLDGKHCIVLRQCQILDEGNSESLL